METGTKPSSEDNLNSEVAPLTACHLFESSSALFGLSSPQLPHNKAHPLSTALNLRHLQTAQANKLLIPYVQEHTIACPSCGCVWIPGINVRVRLITHRTNLLRHRLPKGIIIKDHQNTDHGGKESQADTPRRLSKRARKRKSLKIKHKKEVLDHKLNNVYGLDATYVATRAKELRKKRKVLAYGCGQCHIYHIIDPEITNKYPVASVTAASKKKNSSSLHQNITQERDLENRAENSHQNASKQEGPSNSSVSSRKDKAPSKLKSKKKNSLQMLIAKQKETKSNQQSASGIGLLGLLTKK